jgi:hypothetical protein
VDNLNGIKILGKMIRVDHIHQYKLPKVNFQMRQHKGFLDENYETVKLWLALRPKLEDAFILSIQSFFFFLSV